MVKHQKCHGVGDVDKFLNNTNLRLDQVQIVYGLSRVGGDYYVFYNDYDLENDGTDPAIKARKMPEPPDPNGELQLIPVDRTKGEE